MALIPRVPRVPTLREFFIGIRVPAPVARPRRSLRIPPCPNGRPLAAPPPVAGGPARGRSNAPAVSGVARAIHRCKAGPGPTRVLAYRVKEPGYPCDLLLAAGHRLVISGAYARPSRRVPGPPLVWVWVVLYHANSMQSGLVCRLLWTLWFVQGNGCFGSGCSGWNSCPAAPMFPVKGSARPVRDAAGLFSQEKPRAVAGCYWRACRRMPGRQLGGLPAPW